MKNKTFTVQFLWTKLVRFMILSIVWVINS